MARRIKELRRFERGMFGQADGTDIPDDAASICLNTEPDVPLGTIQGIKEDSTVFSSLTNYTDNSRDFDVAKVLKNRTGTNDIVGVDFSANEVGIISDYDDASSSRAYTFQGSISHNNVASIETVNNQAFVGLGNATNNIPKWIGNINKGQFGGSAPTGPQIEDADIKAPLVIKIDLSTVSSQALYETVGVSTQLVTSLTIGSSLIASLPDRGSLLVPIGTPSFKRTMTISYSGKSSNDLTGVKFPDDFESNYPSSGSPTIFGDTTVSNHNTAYYVEVGAGELSTGSDAAKATGQYILLATTGGTGNTLINANNSSGNNFEENNHYAVGVSYIYDGYKESPITRVPLGHFWYGISTGANSYESLEYNFIIQGFHDSYRTASKRITSIKFYININAPENDNTGENQVNSFRLVKELSIVDDLVGANTLTIGGDVIGRGFTLTAGGYLGDLYTSESGLNEFQTSSALNYAVSCQHNSQLFVGKVLNSSADDENWDNYIVRSIPFSYEVFNWVSDYLVMPNPITAIASHSGRVYAFDDFNMYRINPSQLFIEDTFNGLGAISQQSVLSTEYGLFVANKNGIFMYDGRDARHISMPIDVVTSVHSVFESVSGPPNFDRYGYKSCVETNASFDPKLSFDADKKCLLCYGVHGTASKGRIWIYKIDTGAWFIRSGISEGGTDTGALPSIKAIFISATNSVLATHTNGIFELFRGANRNTFRWISRKLDMGSVSQTKKFRKVTVSGSNSSGLASNSIQLALDGASGPIIDSALDSSASSSVSKNISVSIRNLSAANFSVDDISILYREKPMPV